jgi:adenosylcobinamide-phosphate synthase
MPPLITALALTLDWFLGDPQTWPHPVRFIGRLITATENNLSQRFSLARPSQAFLAGTLLAAVAIGATGLSAYLALKLCGSLGIVLWFLCALYLAFSLICLRDLLNHSERVEEALLKGDINEARLALAWMVGRDTNSLDPEGIRRALIETLSENFSDGMVAPLFYLALGGPVLAWIYKAANTLDSMVGYKNERYLFLGRTSARLDDLLNFLPSRLAALFLIAASAALKGDYRRAMRLWRKEGRFHTSPNSAQTEAAMAGALGVTLGGPSTYCGQIVEKPTLGSSGAPPQAQDVKEAKKLVIAGTAITLIFALALEWAMIGLFHSPPGWAYPG